MNILLLLFLVIAAPLSIIKIRKELRVVKKIRKEKEKLVKEKFPNLSNKDLKYRQKNIDIYQQVYDDSLKKVKLLRMTIIVLVFLIFGGILGGMINIGVLKYNGVSATVINIQTLEIFIFESFLTFILAVLFRFVNPRTLSFEFWKQYLEENPDNELQIVLISEEQLNLVESAYKKAGKYSCLLGIWLLVLGLM